MKTIHPAIAEHAMEDNEKLRGLLQKACELIEEQNLHLDAEMLPAGRSLVEGITAALSKQAEPTDTFTAVDMATVAAQGFRDGQAATVKDCLTVQPMAYAVFAANGNAVCFSTRRDHPSLVALEKEGHSVVSLAPIKQAEQQWPTAYPHEAMDKMAADRYRVGSSGAGTFHRFAVRAGDGEQELYRGSESDCQNVARKLAGAFLDGGFAFQVMLAAPIAQTAPQSEQSRMAEALGAFVSLAEDRLHELGALSPEMAECLTNGRAALSAQGESHD